jgi:hypothetical protein
VRVTNRELRRRIRKILSESYIINESAYTNVDLVKKATSIAGAPTYKVSGTLASDILNAITNFTKNFGQAFEQVGAQIIAKEIPGSEPRDLNPNANSSDPPTSGGDAEFADMIIDSGGKTNNLTLAELKDCVFISAKSVEGPFEFTGEAVVSKMKKLLRNTVGVDFSSFLAGNPSGKVGVKDAQIKLRVGGSYVALDLVNTQSTGRLVYDMQIVIPNEPNVALLPKGTLAKYGSRLLEKDLAFRQFLPDNLGKVSRAMLKNDAHLKDTMSLIHAAYYPNLFAHKTIDTESIRKQIVKNFQEMFDTGTEDKYRIGYNKTNKQYASWYQSFIDLLNPANPTAAQSFWTMTNGFKWTQIHSLLINKATDKIASNIMHYLKNEHPSTGAPMAGQTQLPDLRNEIISSLGGGTFVSTQHLNLQVIENLVRAKLNQKYPQSQTYLNRQPALLRGAYLSSVESANRMQDLSKGAVRPDLIQYTVGKAGRARFDLTKAIEDDGEVVALKAPDAKGNNIAKQIKDTDKVGNLSSFITNTILVPDVTYKFSKIIIEEGPYDAEGEEAYKTIVAELIGRAASRQVTGSLRRQYSDDASAVPQASTKQDVDTAKTEIDQELSDLQDEIETKLAGQTLLTKEQQTALVEGATARLRGGFATMEGTKSYAASVLRLLGLTAEADMVEKAQLKDAPPLPDDGYFMGIPYNFDELDDEIDSKDINKDIEDIEKGMKEYIERGENIKLTRNDLRQLISQGETSVNPYDGIDYEDLAVEVIGMIKDHIKKLTSPKIIELLNSIIALPANVANESRIYENILKKILYTAKKRQ